MYVVEFRNHTYVINAPTDTVAKTRLVKVLNHEGLFEREITNSDIDQMVARRLPSVSILHEAYELPGSVNWQLSAL